MKKLTYIGTHEFGYYLYKDEDGRMYANINFMLSDKNGLHTLSGNQRDGEPEYPISSFYEGDVTFKDEPDERMEWYKPSYRLLSRLKSDCDYFLGNGKGFAGHLWAGSVERQIVEMKKLWEDFPDDLKPEWLTLEQIDEYHDKMKEYVNKE